MECLSRLLDGFQSIDSEACLIDERGTHVYRDLRARLDQWESWLARSGISPGALVALRADYSLHSVSCLLALWANRCIVALIPRDRAVSSYLRDAYASWQLDVETDGGIRLQTVPQIASHPLIETLRETQDGGVILFTSGSTGRPKAALQSAERLLLKFRKPGRRFRTLAFLMLDHIAGLDTLLYTLSSGGSLVLARSRDPRSIVRLIEKHRVEVLPASPSFLRLLCASELSAEQSLASIKIITYGSELMDPTTLERLNARFPNAQISQKYGTTETGAPRSVSRGNDSLWMRIKSDDVETKVVEDVLWIRSGSTILGYLNAPSPVDAHGWYCTGDLVEVDGEWIRFRGRKSDVINVGGEKVSPAEVEEVILELDLVKHAVVCGEPHPLMGQVVTARVVLTSASLKAKDAARRIQAHCRSRLASYKTPMRVTIVSEELINERQKALRSRGASSP
jgi:long-chain acyl-CoA synthetase